MQDNFRARKSPHTPSFTEYLSRFWLQDLQTRTRAWHHVGKQSAQLDFRDENGAGKEVLVPQTCEGVNALTSFRSAPAVIL